MLKVERKRKKKKSRRQQRWKVNTAAGKGLEEIHR